MTAESPTLAAARKENSMEKLKPLQRRRKCKICGGLTHPLAMTELGMCQACRELRSWTRGQKVEGSGKRENAS